MGKTSSRYSVLVPDIESRLNMGKPEGGDDAFGYEGISLHTAENFFTNVSKCTMVQTKTMHISSGGAWNQFSSNAMSLSCKKNGLFTAAGKVTICAGAGMGQVSQRTVGTAPIEEAYNNLDLHYKVEKIQVTLKNLLYGKGWEKEQEDAAESAGRLVQDARLQARRSSRHHGRVVHRSRLRRGRARGLSQAAPSADRVRG